MNKKMLPLLALLVSVTTLSNAQTKDKPAKEKEKEVIIRKSDGSKEKTTIVIDGNDITVNGKPLDQLKEEDVELLNEKGIGSMLPGIRGRVAPLGSLKMFGEAMPSINSNSAYLGVTSTPSEKGAQVVSVLGESPAAKAGLKKDDIITRVNDTKIENSADLHDAIGKFKPAEKVNITYLRGDKEATTAITLEKNVNESRSLKLNGREFDFNNDFNFNMPELRNLPRIKGMDLSLSRKPRLGIGIQDLEEGSGVKILDVDDDTPASKAGLKKDDVISELDGKSIASVDDLQSALNSKKEGDSFKLSFKRNGQTQTTEIRFPKKLKTAEL